MSQGGDGQRSRLGVPATPRLAIAYSSPLVAAPARTTHSAVSTMHRNRRAPHHRATGRRAASRLPPITSRIADLENP